MQNGLSAGVGIKSNKIAEIGCVDDVPYLYIGGSISVLKEDKGMYKAIL